MEPTPRFLELYCRLDLSKSQLYGTIPDICTILRKGNMLFAGHCCGSNQEFASDLLFWIHSHEASISCRPEITYIVKLCYKTRCHSNDLPNLMQDRAGLRIYSGKSETARPNSNKVRL